MGQSHWALCSNIFLFLSKLFFYFLRGLFVWVFRVRFRKLCTNSSFQPDPCLLFMSVQEMWSYFRGKVHSQKMSPKNKKKKLKLWSLRCGFQSSTDKKTPQQKWWWNMWAHNEYKYSCQHRAVLWRRSGQLFYIYIATMCIFKTLVLFLK